MIELLSAVDVPDDVALSRSVGWPDTEADWRVLHAGAQVLGIRDERRLVGPGVPEADDALRVGESRELIAQI